MSFKTMHAEYVELQDLPLAQKIDGRDESSLSGRKRCIRRIYSRHRQATTYKPQLHSWLCTLHLQLPHISLMTHSADRPQSLQNAFISACRE